MANYLNRFSVKLTEYIAPLRELTKKHVHFRWEPHHQAALDRIKKELSSPRVISYHDPNQARPTILQCDTSQNGSEHNSSHGFKISHRYREKIFQY